MKLLAESIRAEGGALPWDRPFAWDAHDTPTSVAAVAHFAPRSASVTVSDKETDHVRRAALAA